MRSRYRMETGAGAVRWVLHEEPGTAWRPWSVPVAERLGEPGQDVVHIADDPEVGD